MDSKKIESFSKGLERLGSELAKIQFDFKIKNKPSEKYWNQRIDEFRQYHEKTIEYFLEAQQLAKLFDEKEAGVFLLKLSKLKQLGSNLLKSMELVKNNPSIMDSKDQQQSRWTIEQREKLFEANQECLDHEKTMNVFFRQFYDKHLKKD